MPYSNRWFRVVERAGSFWIDEPRSQQSAATLVIVNAEHVALLQLRRAPHSGLQLEIPRGYAEAGETSLDCALREVLEETGYRVSPANLVSLGTLKPNSSILGSRIPVYLAAVTDADKVAGHDEEVQSVQLVPLAGMNELIRSGDIEDAFTLSAWAFYQAYVGSPRTNAIARIGIDL